MNNEVTLPQIIAEELRAEISDTPGVRIPADVISTVTECLMARRDVRTEANWRWALRTCVRALYVNARSRSKPSAAAIERLRTEDQHALPGWDDLLKWTIKFEDGTEIPAALGTLAQVDYGANQYLQLGRQNTVKGRFLAALGDAMRGAGFDASSTVAEFYEKAA